MRDDTQLLNNGLDSELDSYDTAEDIKRTDYIYMVSGNNLVISLNAELDHHLADEMRDVIDTIIEICRSRQITTVCMGQPAFQMPSSLLKISKYRKFLRALKEMSIDLIILA